MDIVFGQLHLLMLGTELEAVPADTVSFELCIYSYLRASCVHSDRVCRLYSFIINVLLLFECRWSHSLQILLHVRNICDPPYDFRDKGDNTLTTRSHLKTKEIDFNTLTKLARAHFNELVLLSHITH